MPACLCCPFFPAVWQRLALPLQNSDVIHSKDWAELGFLFISVAHTRSVEEGNSNPLQYSCLENLMIRGAWWAVPKQTQRKQLSIGSVLTLWAGFAHPISVDFHVTQRTGSCAPPHPSTPARRANCPEFLRADWASSVKSLTRNGPGRPAEGGRGKGCATPPTSLGLRESGLRLAGGPQRPDPDAFFIHPSRRQAPNAYCWPGALGRQAPPGRGRGPSSKRG